MALLDFLQPADEEWDTALFRGGPDSCAQQVIDRLPIRPEQTGRCAYY